MLAPCGDEIGSAVQRNIALSETGYLSARNAGVALHINLPTKREKQMLNNLNTTQKCARAHFSPTTPAQKPSATQKLEQVRNRVRFAQRSVTASEGRLLDFDTAEAIGRALSMAVRDLEELALQMAVMARKAMR